MADCRHCFHANGPSSSTCMTSNNIVRGSERCCHCGSVREWTAMEVRPPGHGPFAPTEHLQRVETWS